MPRITFEAGRLKPEIKAELMRRLAEVSVEVTGVPLHLHYVAIHELPDDDIAIGGVTVAEMKRQAGKA